LQVFAGPSGDNNDDQNEDSENEDSDDDCNWGFGGGRQRRANHRESFHMDMEGEDKEIQIILRLFIVIAMYCQASSSQIKSITQPAALLAGLEGSLGTCSRWQFTRNNLYTI
jgi:hypothetical protein